MIGRFCRVALAVCLAVFVSLAPIAPAYAQNPAQSTPPPPQPQPQAPPRTIEISNQDYTSGKPWFPRVWEPYTPTTVPEPILTNAPKIEQMIQDGKLRISLQDAVDLALQNNLDISIQRYTPYLAEANILRTLSGAASSFGSIGSIGNVPAQTFDPQVVGTFSLDQRAAPVNNPLTSGTGTGTNTNTFPTLNTHTAVGNIQYLQGFHTGTSFSAGFNNTRASTSSSANFFSPSVTSNFVFVANQQLLNGFGLLVNERYIRIAKLNKNIADQTFRQQVITSITAVSNAYWELVFARGNVDVAQHQIELANKLYSDNKKQVDVGTLAPLEIVQAEAQVATANQTLIVDQTTLLQDQLTLLNLITKDPETPALRTAEIIPTDTADAAPPEVEKIALEDLIKEAITKRPDVLTSSTTLQGDDINVKVTKNALLPVVSLSAEYASQGLAGDNRPAATCVPTPPATSCQIITGLANSLGDMFAGVYPEYNAGVTLTIPIRNRAAQANNVTALLNQRMDEARYRQILNNVAIDVHTAQIILEQARVTVGAAIKTQDLDQQTLDAEQKKYQLGASTLFNVVSDQNTLAAAAAAAVRARVNLVEAKVNFDRAMARTFEVYNITIADARSGSVTKDTLIPGTSASGQLVAEPVKQPAASASSSTSSASAVAAKQ